MSSDQKRPDLGFGKSNIDDVIFPIWFYGKVVSVFDGVPGGNLGNAGPFDSGRIKVRIDQIDQDVKLSDELKDPKEGGLPWCEPLLPKFINIMPRVGEVVKVAVFDVKSKKLRRQYIGPVIAQQRPPEFMESYEFPAKLKVDTGSGYFGSWTKEPVSVDGDWKIYPDKDDISIIGRRNSDFILRYKSNYDEIILRAGKIDYKSILDNQGENDFSRTFSLNKKNPAYITINHSLPQNLQGKVNPPPSKTADKLNLNNDRSHINIVADNLNLISHKGSNKKGFVRTILKGDDLLTQIKTENEKLHPLVYGDVLWEFLTLLKNYVSSHIHEGPKLPADPSEATLVLTKWFNDNMGNVKTKTSTDGAEYKEIENCKFLSKGVKTN
jgi:hypothetical protein